jgi:hypothetical protein
MGKMKELVMEAEDMLINGYDIDDVSLILGLPIKAVKEISDRVIGAKQNGDYETEV